MGGGANSISKNYETWNNTYDWKDNGEEWSVAWGGSKAQWNGAILPRIAPWLPAQTLLEIAPGHGRWTEFLIPQAINYFGVDLSDKCIEFCKTKFQNENNAKFYVNNGYDLSMIKSESCDFVFSFDSLVHVEFNTLKNYITEILRILKPKIGIAFIHHSNLGKFPNKNVGWRAKDVNHLNVGEHIIVQKGYIWVQEEINWSADICTDCFTLFGVSKCPNTVYIENKNFMLEAELIKNAISKYHPV
jgi:SAM-dependent methyltransferase